jgi:hypothetical protein
VQADALRAYLRVSIGAGDPAVKQEFAGYASAIYGTLAGEEVRRRGVAGAAFLNYSYDRSSLVFNVQASVASVLLELGGSSLPVSGAALNLYAGAERELKAQWPIDQRCRPHIAYNLVRRDGRWVPDRQENGAHATATRQALRHLVDDLGATGLRALLRQHAGKSVAGSHVACR